MKQFVAFLTVFLSLTLVFSFAGTPDLEKGKRGKIFVPRQAAMERAPGTFDAAGYLKSQREKFDWLMAEAAPLSPQAMVDLSGLPRQNR